MKWAFFELQVREKQMRVFMTSLNDLKSTLHEEELKKNEEDYNNDSEGANIMMVIMRVEGFEK